MIQKCKREKILLHSNKKLNRLHKQTNKYICNILTTLECIQLYSGFSSPQHPGPISLIGPTLGLAPFLSISCSEVSMAAPTQD